MKELHVLLISCVLLIIVLNRMHMATCNKAQETNCTVDYIVNWIIIGSLMASYMYHFGLK